MKKIISTFLIFVFNATLIHSTEPTLTSPLPQATESSIDIEPPPVGTYQFIYDRNFTPYAGGENLLTLHRGIEKFEENSPLKEKPGFLPGFSRAMELIFGWLPINYMTMVVQHEVFGHGYRIRDFGKDVATVTKYTFKVPPPFGPGGAATRFEFKSDPSFSQALALTGGGVEATGILAHQLRMQWIKTGTLPAQEALLYSFSQGDLPAYVNSLKSNFKILDDAEGHDIKAYLNLLHYAYPAGDLSAKELKQMAKIRYFDPFTYFAAFSWFKYILTGYETSIPMFKFKSVSYLPSARLTLTPFGPQYTLDNYIKYKDVPTYVYVKRGKFAGNRFWSIGLLNESLFTYKAHAFGARLDLWHQPKLLSLDEWGQAYVGYLHKQAPDLFSEEELRHSPSTKPLRTLHFGAAGALTYKYALFPERLTMHVELGYKSAGYLAGESLREGLLARLALNARF